MVELHKLSDFTGEDAVGIVCDLLPAIGDIVKSIDQKEMQGARNNLAAVGMMFRADKRATMDIISTLAKEPVESEKLTGPDMSSAMFQLAGDEGFFSLFGYQSKTAPSSGSASTTTEGEPSEV